MREGYLVISTKLKIEDKKKLATIQCYEYTTILKNFTSPLRITF